MKCYLFLFYLLAANFNKQSFILSQEELVCCWFGSGPLCMGECPGDYIPIYEGQFPVEHTTKYPWSEGTEISETPTARQCLSGWGDVPCYSRFKKVLCCNKNLTLIQACKVHAEAWKNGICPGNIQFQIDRAFDRANERVRNDHKFY